MSWSLDRPASSGLNSRWTYSGIDEAAAAAAAGTTSQQNPNNTKANQGRTPLESEDIAVCAVVQP
jgi:hypothetical protein